MSVPNDLHDDVLGAPSSGAALDEGSDADLKQRNVRGKSDLLVLAFGSLGVVFGDIGTSPLYAFSSLFTQQPRSTEDVLGAASLTFWILTIILMLKYVVIVLRADDHGEGGTFAMFSLLCRSFGINPLGNKAPEADKSLTTYSNGPHDPQPSKLPVPSTAAASSTGRTLKSAFQNRVWLQKTLLMVSMAATCMVLGDGVFTPAISVFSAVAGLNTLVPQITTSTIVAVTVALLITIFMVQQFGTHRVSLCFAPIVMLWFLALTGISIFRFAIHGGGALAAINPWYIIKFFRNRGNDSWKELGSVVLVVTGAEALYADMGHFSRPAMMLSASAVAYPALALTYLSQAAYLIHKPQAHTALFWSWVPGRIQWPMLILATAATIIASQALISASFSLVSQAMNLGLFPIMTIKYTGAKHSGQIYIREINFLLMLACVLVVAMFQDTAALGNAYGLTVVIVMAVTTSLLSIVMLVVWGWWLVAVLAVCGPLLALELAIMVASLRKVPDGAWVALLVAGLVMGPMLVWWYVQDLKHRAIHGAGSPGRHPLQSLLALKDAPVAAGTAAPKGADGAEQVAEVVHIATGRTLARTMGVGVFYTPFAGEAPKLLDHLLTLIPALPEVVVLLDVHYAPVSNVTEEERFLVDVVSGLPNSYQVLARYGYMDKPRHDQEFILRMMEAIAAQVRKDWLNEVQPIAKNVAQGAAAGPVPNSSRSEQLPASVTTAEHEKKVGDIEQGGASAAQPPQGGASAAQPPQLQQATGLAEGSSRAGLRKGSGSVPLNRRSVELEKACKEGVVQVVAHEVVQSKQGSSMTKQLLVDIVYPNLALGARRASRTMQLLPNSTLEVMLIIQV